MASIGLAYSVPREQKLIYKITPAPGRLMKLENIGGQMVAIAKLLKSCAKQEKETAKCEVLILNIMTSEAGEITFEVAIAPRAAVPHEEMTE